MSTPKAPADHFTLLYFASATSFTRKQHDFFAAPLPLAKLYEAAEEKYPGIKAKVLESSALTVNLDYVDVEEEVQKGDKGLVIQAGDEVAIIPPVSSGKINSGTGGYRSGHQDEDNALPEFELRYNETSALGDVAGTGEQFHNDGSLLQHRYTLAELSADLSEAHLSFDSSQSHLTNSSADAIPWTGGLLPPDVYAYSSYEIDGVPGEGREESAGPQHALLLVRAVGEDTAPWPEGDPEPTVEHGLEESETIPPGTSTLGSNSGAQTRSSWNTNTHISTDATSYSRIYPSVRHNSVTSSTSTYDATKRPTEDEWVTHWPYEIRDRIMFAAGEPQYYDRVERGVLYDFEFVVHWNPRQYLDAYYEASNDYGLENTIVLTGRDEVLKASTCGAYLQEMWPWAGVEVVRALQLALRGGLGLTRCDTRYDILGACEIKFHQKDDMLHVRVTAPISAVVEIAEQLTFLGAACAASEKSNDACYCTHTLGSTAEFGSKTPRRVYIQYSVQSSNGEAQCWKALFRNPRIACGFPARRRDPRFKGMEMSGDIMIKLGNLI
ncbi:hypothetical protein LTR27_001871 [Elasticomyces elasticus]|nr:hypothetical protein LTR27_001871 [Elasticomyces elasticus]